MLSDQKLTLGLLATITLEVVPFRAHPPFPVLLPFLNASWEVVFCEGVQHRLRVCLDHLNCVKWRPFSFITNRGHRIVGWVGTKVMLLLVRNSMVKKEV
jgi:hypothetical protein